MKTEGLARIPADALLAEELAFDEVVEMANLTSSQTGVPGTIFISTAMGAHGPRVKYFVQPGRTQPSFSISIGDSPGVIANNLPTRTLRQMSPRVMKWVSQTRMTCWISGITAIPGRSLR